jgi:hypothetical protein
VGRPVDDEVTLAPAAPDRSGSAGGVAAVEDPVA